ncbi:xanthine dehydrogenase-like [Saccoglossus kowalevskii]
MAITGGRHPQLAKYRVGFTKDGYLKALDVDIEGAFLQGYGLLKTEELHWSDKGQLLSTGPGTYNVPRVQDIPREFNIHLMPNSDNPKAVFSSKGVGEPPLVLAASVLFVVKEAIRSVRMETNGDYTDFKLDTPATAQKIRMACGDCFEIPERP